MSAEVVAALAQAHRRDWAQVFATTAQPTRDLDLAEECTQDAYAQALQTWTQTGIPDRPGAWLTTIARNQARDVLRRESVFRRALPLLVPDESVPRPEDGLLDDDRLRLVFTCCHPALSRDAQIALTPPTHPPTQTCHLATSTLTLTVWSVVSDGVHDASMMAGVRTRALIT
jgi:RNA polymerase sigma-70 factor (ECF subfamily)